MLARDTWSCWSVDGLKGLNLNPVPSPAFLPCLAAHVMTVASFYRTREGPTPIGTQRMWAQGLGLGNPAHLLNGNRPWGAEVGLRD